MCIHTVHIRVSYSRGGKGEYPPPPGSNSLPLNISRGTCPWVPLASDTLCVPYSPHVSITPCICIYLHWQVHYILVADLISKPMHCHNYNLILYHDVFWHWGISIETLRILQGTQKMVSLKPSLHLSFKEYYPDNNCGKHKNFSVSTTHPHCKCGLSSASA